ILEVITRQDGLYLPAMEEEREQESLLVEDAMATPEWSPLDGNLTVSAALALVNGSGDQEFLIARDNTGWGFVTSEELKRFIAGGRGQQTLNEILPDRLVPHVYSDQDLDVALRYTQEWKMIPVVSRTNVTRMKGVIQLNDVLNAYRQAQ